MGIQLVKGSLLARAAKLCGFGVAMFFMLSAPSAWAVDGVAEINQACAVTTGCFSGDTPGYPVTIDGSAGASYRLTSTLIVPDSNTNGIEIFASSIGIDLNNFEIASAGCESAVTDCTPTSGVGFGIKSSVLSLKGISVKNGSIVGMGFQGVDAGEQAEVRNLRARWNRFDGINVLEGSVVSGCTAHQNGRNGIMVGGGSTVSGSVAYENGFTGVVANAGSVVSGNAVYKNSGFGMIASDGSTVSGNASYENGSDGIQAGGGSTVQGNTLRANGGYGLDLGADAAYRENVITGNTTGTVTGGVNLYSNSCNGSTVCP